MENQLSVDKILKIYETLAGRSFDDFKPKRGGLVNRVLDAFCCNMQQTFGALEPNRVVDYCIYVVRKCGNHPRPFATMFGKAYIERFANAKAGRIHYENEWLESIGLSRAALYAKAGRSSSHALAPYVYLVAEDSTKRRMLNSEVGYMLCQASTLGWTPFSPCCQNCDFADPCKKETENKYPELYRLRIERYGESGECID